MLPMFRKFCLFPGRCNLDFLQLDKNYHIFSLLSDIPGDSESFKVDASKTSGTKHWFKMNLKKYWN